MANIKLVSAIAATAISFSVSVNSASSVISDSNKISASLIQYQQLIHQIK